MDNNTPPGITLVAATHRPGSKTQAIARKYHEMLAGEGLEAQLLSLAELPEGFLFSDLYGKRSEPFQRIEVALQRTDVFVFVVPEYNGSFPGELKLMLDALNPQKTFWGKKAALIGVSDGKFGNLRGLDHLTAVLHYVRVEVMPFRAHLMLLKERMDANQRLVHEASLQELSTHARQLVQFIRQPVVA